MTDAELRKVTCSSCGNEYQGVYYLSLSSFTTSDEEKQKMESGQLHKSKCPKCGTENDVTDDLPQWTVEDLKKSKQE